MYMHVVKYISIFMNCRCEYSSLMPKHLAMAPFFTLLLARVTPTHTIKCGQPKAPVSSTVGIGGCLYNLDNINHQTQNLKMQNDKINKEDKTSILFLAGIYNPHIVYINTNIKPMSEMTWKYSYYIMYRCTLCKYILNA